MIDKSNDWKYNARLLINGLTPHENSNNEETLIIQCLKPLKDKIIEIVLSKGPISLISSILEIFYDKKKKILSEEEIVEGIKNKLNNNIITVYEEPIIFYLDSNNFIEKIIKILSNKEYFEILIIQEKQYIKINTKNIKKKLNILLNELKEQYNILTDNPKISIELDEEKEKEKVHKINLGPNIAINKIINNKDINFNNIHNNKIIINTDVDRNAIIKGNIENKKINNNVINVISDMNNNKNEVKESGLGVNIHNSFNKINNMNSINNINNNNIFNTNKEKMINEISDSDNINNKGSNKMKKISKTFLKKKKNSLNNYSFIIPYSNSSEDVNNESNSHNKSTSINSFSSLSVESLSFSCIPRKKEKHLLEKIINYITFKNKELYSTFGGDNVKEREEKKIKKLKQEITQKNLEIKLHEYVIQCWENENYEEGRDNANLIGKINEDFKNDYKRLNEEMEVLFASHFIINRRNKLKNDNYADGIKKDFKYNYNVCVELYKKINNNKSKYLLWLNKIIKFIKNVNKIDLDLKEIKEEGNDIVIYKEELESIKNIMDYLRVFEELVKKNI